MPRTLALSLRPKRFSEMIGQKAVTDVIKKQLAKREPPAWMFTGPTGSGKTTIARILANSLQCGHGEVGEPCDTCLKDSGNFATIEVNASEMNGVEQIGELAKTSVYNPAPPSKKRIFIFDEAQRLSTAAQNLLLKYFEDSPKSTVWMVCTTEPNRILATLRRRCKILEMKALQDAGITKLVARAYDAADAKKGPPQAALVHQLGMARIQSPALILNAVENYLAEMSAKDAVKHLVTESDSLAICLAMEAGDWDQIKKEVENLTNDELRGVRASTAGFLKKKLLATVPGPRGDELARALDTIAKVDSFTDVTAGPTTVSALYKITRIFKGPDTEREEEYE